MQLACEFLGKAKVSQCV